MAMAIANASIFTLNTLLDSMTRSSDQWFAVKSQMFRPCFFAPQTFDATHAFSINT